MCGYDPVVQLPLGGDKEAYLHGAKADVSCVSSLFIRRFR